MFDTFVVCEVKKGDLSRHLARLCHMDGGQVVAVTVNIRPSFRLHTERTVVRFPAGLVYTYSAIICVQLRPSPQRDQ